jgi:hypothetical protein
LAFYVSVAFYELGDGRNYLSGFYLPLRNGCCWKSHKEGEKMAVKNFVSRLSVVTVITGGFK